MEGRLGCPNCRDAFPVRGGVADLRPPPRSEPGPPIEAPPPLLAAAAVAALLGVDGGPGLGLVLGDGLVGAAGALAAVSAEMSWVAARPTGWGPEEMDGVSRILVGHVLPFHDRSLRAVAAEIGTGVVPGEFARVTGRGARVLLTGMDSSGALELRRDAEEFTTLMEEGGTILLQRV